MLDFGWKKKAERLRMVILSGAHQLAKELHPGIVRILELFEQAHKTGDASNLKEEIDRVTVAAGDSERGIPIWEPAEIYGWTVRATLYLRNAQLWWLVQASRRNEKPPGAKEIAFLDKVLVHLGGDPKQDIIIGPLSSPPGHEPLHFGWWTWRNRSDLFEVQVNKNKKNPKDMVRVVPIGAPETDGYTTLPREDDVKPPAEGVYKPPTEGA